MPISYVRYTSLRPVTNLHNADYLLGVRVLLFDPVLEEHGAKSIGERFREIDISFRDADFIFFRGSTHWKLRSGKDFRSVVTKDPIIKSLRKKSSSKIGFLHIPKVDDKHEPAMIVELLDSKDSAPLSPIDWLPILRRTEIMSLIKQADALFSNGHFALPSGLHTNSHLSIRRLLSDPLTVSRLADWLLIDVSKADGILTDQAPMLPLIFALQALTAHIRHSLPPVEVLEDYPADLKTISDALQVFNDVSGGTKQLVFLMSVSRSGRLGRYYRTAAASSSVLRVLFSIGGNDPEELEALIHIPIDDYSLSQQESCELCISEDKPLQRINPASHEPETALPRQIIRATADNLSKLSRFWGIADEMDAVRLHFYDEHARHHAVYLEISRLLAHNEFRATCVEKLRSLSRSPNLVIIPNHSSSQVLRDLVREALPTAGIEILPERTIRIPDELHPRIAAASQVLLVDDAVITTKTVTDLKLQIYQICKYYERSPGLDVFVVLARPSTSEHLRWLSNRLRDSIGGHLHYAYKVFLPYPSTLYCPFCDERKMLTRYMDKLSKDAAAIAKRRLRWLRNEVKEPLFGVAATPRRVVNSFMATNADLRPRNASSRTIVAATQAAAIALIDEVKRQENDGKLSVVDIEDIISKY